MAYSERKINRAISVILGIIAALLVVSALIIAIKHYWPKKENYDEFKNSSETVVEELAENPINFAALKEQNDDVCAWIKFDSEDISVDNPILRAGEEEEEDYYLHRDIEKKNNVAGAIYIQKINSIDFSDPCTIVYGHNMKNLTMFGSLKYLRKKDVFDNNEYFYIYTPGQILKYAIKSAFVYDDRHIMYSFDFTTEDGFMAFAKEASDPKSLTKYVRDDVEIKKDSKLVVLSTCTGASDQRYLVVGVLTESIKTK